MAPGAAANLIANGGAIYNGFVITACREPGYEVLTEESLEAILRMFGRAKAKVAFRDRPKGLSATMIGAGLKIWEDLRGVDLGWLGNVAGVPPRPRGRDSAAQCRDLRRKCTFLNVFCATPAGCIRFASWRQTKFARVFF